MPDLVTAVRDGVLHLTLNRPETHNALTPEMIVRLADTWRAFEADNDLRVAVITGTGQAAFCSGADLAALVPLLTGERPPADEWEDRFLDDRSLLDTALQRRFDVSKPVIAAVNGWALAGGVELLLATDLRVASNVATFGLPEVTRGVIPAGGSLARLPRQLPYAVAMELLLLGDRIDALEAHRIGLVNRVVAPAEVADVADEMARRLCENGPLALRKVKEGVRRASGVPLSEAFDVEDECNVTVLASSDAREGPRAFRERRPPVFTGH